MEDKEEMVDLKQDEELKKKALAEDISPMKPIELDSGSEVMTTPQRVKENPIRGKALRWLTLFGKKRKILVFDTDSDESCSEPTTEGEKGGKGKSMQLKKLKTPPGVATGGLSESDGSTEDPPTGSDGENLSKTMTEKVSTTACEGVPGCSWFFF